MKVGMLLAVMFSASAAQSQPLADASSWYVLIGKHSEPWSLCYANIVAEKFKDGTYVEAEAAESAKRDEDIQCKVMPPTDEEKTAQKECDDAKKSEAEARDMFEKGIHAAGGQSLSDAEKSTHAACINVSPFPKFAGRLGGCT